MSEKKGKPVRLSKVMREINCSKDTVVDFLKTKDIVLEGVTPNTKIETEVYEVLLEHFKPDLLANLKAKQEEVPKGHKESVAIDHMIKEEPKVEEAPKEEAPAEEVKSETVEVEESKAEEPAETKEEPVEEKTVEEEATPEVVTEAVEEQKPTEEPTVEAEKPEAKEETSAPAEKEEPSADAEDDSPLNVVGKIDLASINSKTKPKKSSKKDIDAQVKAKKEGEKKFREQQAAEAKVKAKQDADAKAKADLEEENRKKEAAKKPEEELIKAKADKLSGPTVLGKIELPVDRKPKGKKPVASSDDASKRKRKRISKVDVKKEGNRKGGKFQKGGKKPFEKKPELSEKDIQKEIKETLAKLSGGGKSKSVKNRRAKRDAVSQKLEEQRQREEQEQKVLKVTEFVTAAELASMMDVSPTDIISACMSLGMMVAINQRLDSETLSIVAEEFGYEVEFVSAEDNEVVLEEEDNEERMSTRSPIVTVMGHVDHGKTSLLDYYRKSNVIDDEAGGITQHIGAYSIKVHDDKEVTFLDTPGHEAFTAMRARGAQVTDLCIIVIAADDSIMPQTREAINHAQAAEVPMIFAINKIDKPGANPDKIREELSAMNILVEDWGGKFQCQEISAKKGQNMDELLEKVLLEAEMLELKADAEKRGVGTVIESALDKGRGYVTTLLVQSGTLKIGDVFLAGSESGRIKAMQNEWGEPIKEAGPSKPVSVLGLNGAVSAGDKFHVLEDEREARGIASKRQQLQREQGIRTQKHITLDEIGRRLAVGDFQELNIILKGDVDGSIQALSDSFQKLSTEKIQVNIIHKGVGPISESDVLLASASDAIIIGFQVRPVSSAKKLAEKEEIDIRTYSIIYDAINDLKDAMEGMLSPEIKEEVIGNVEVRETFKISKVGTIAGCFVLDGKVTRNSKIRIIREGVVVHTGALGSLKRFKDDVKEVKKGFECGLNIEKYNDIKVGDIIEVYEEVEVKAKLK